MAQLPSAFKSKGKENMNDFSIIPLGDYPAAVVKSDYIQTSNKDGHRATLQLKILSGKYKGKYLFVGLNLDNKSEACQEMAEKELATICRAIGIPGIEDTAELHGTPMCVTVGLKAATEKYPEKNIITFYKNIDAYTGEDPVESDAAESGDTESGETKKSGKIWDRK